MFIAISLVDNGEATTKWKRFIYRRNNSTKATYQLTQAV